MKSFLKRFIRRSDENWSIGIYVANSSLHLQPAPNIRNPVLTARDVTDIRAKFVADPFMICKDGVWYMFFEALNGDDGLGDISLATSADGFNWTYQQVVLDEPFHLSYPYVFQWNDEYYMVPETFQTNEVRLYKAASFPNQWLFEKTLLKGADYVDSSLVYFNEKWWIFSSTTSNDILRLHYADDLLGEWIEHPSSPLITNNLRIARPAGRIIDLDNCLIRFTQDDQLTYGRQVHAFKITELTLNHYLECEMLDGKPILSPGGSRWNAVGMHHVDLHRIDSEKWIACVDGRSQPTVSVFGFSLK